MRFVNTTYVFDRGAGPELQKDFNSLFLSFKQHNDCTMTVKEAWDAMKQLLADTNSYKELWGIRHRDS
jgi:hypothetical protein